MNNNRTDEQALLAGGKGVFSKTSYITFGSKEKPEEYDKKEKPRSALVGKQLGTSFPKSGKTPDAYFEKKFNWISDGDKYQDRWRYVDSQQEKKKGFLTSDFSKRDEFSNVTRTGQWREMLKQEDKHGRKALQMFADQAGLDTTTYSPQKEEPETFLYDLLSDKEDPNFIGASRTHKDTSNPTRMSTKRNLGTNMTTNALTYTPNTDFSKPEFARKPIIRDTFYRGTNIHFPSNCSADPDA